MLTQSGRHSTVRSAFAAGLAALVATITPALAAPRGVPSGTQAASAVERSAVERYGALPMRFEPNVGQFDERVEFVARASGYTLFLTPGEAVLVLRQSGGEAPDLAQRRRGAETRRPEPAVVRTHLVGASIQAAAEGVGEVPGTTNYFLGDDPSHWRTGIVSYAAVRYGEVYPGVDMVYYGNQRELEYDFVVAPGADPSAIRMHVTGAERVAVDERGDLVLEVAGGELRQRAPVIYQEGPNGRERVAGGYVAMGDQVGFAVGSYDPSRPLVVDPVLAYSTDIGSNFPIDGWEWGEGVAVGPDGSAYVTGFTNTPGFPDGEPPPWPSSDEVFVMKLDPTGSAIVYVTLLGGDSFDTGSSIAVDADGSAYVAGKTISFNFPTVSPFQANYSGEGDAFVAKLSPSGSALVYSTFLGGTGRELDYLDPARGTGIAVDATGSAYVAGFTSSTNFPVAGAAFQATYRGGPYDMFVTKLGPSGSSLVYSTYLGGAGDDRGERIALHTDGSVYVTGHTSSTNFPKVSPFQANIAGGVDAFVTKLAPSGSSLVYSTYLGGSSDDYAYAIALDAGGSAYVTGYTTSSNFPTASPFQANNNSSDAFVTKLSPPGSALAYSTYLGGNDQDIGFAIAVGADGDAYVTGYTYSSDFPLEAPVQANLGGIDDAFVTRLAPSGASLVYSTYLGGVDYDEGNAIAVGADGSAYAVRVIYEVEFDTYLPTDSLIAKIVPGERTTVGVYTPETGAWFLRNINAPGAADSVFTFGAGGAGRVPLSGDWDGDGDDTPGLYDPSSGAFFLRNANAGGSADLVFTFGAAGAGLVPLAGDWNGDGVDTIGLYAPATGAFFLRNTNSGGNANLVFTFGAGGQGYLPLAGDWNGDGIDTVGLYAPTSSTFFLRNSNDGGNANRVFTFGAGGGGFAPLSGDWNDDGTDTVGLAATSTGTFFLRNTNAPGPADLVFSYGPPGATPLAGDWDGE